MTNKDIAEVGERTSEEVRNWGVRWKDAETEVRAPGPPGLGQPRDAVEPGVGHLPSQQISETVLAGEQDRKVQVLKW